MYSKADTDLLSYIYHNYNSIIQFLNTLLGETGLGKSTLMDSLFNTNFESTPSSHKVS